MGALFKQLSDDLSTLVRQELRLAQAEMTEKGKKAGLGLGMFGGAGVVGFLALQALTACLIAAAGHRDGGVDRGADHHRRLRRSSPASWP